MSEFDDDVAVRPEGDGRWQAVLTPRWNIGEAPNGGYLLATVLSAVARSVPHPDPLSVSAHYVSRAEPGPADVAVEVLRTGLGVSTARGRLSQSGSIRLEAMATYGDLEAAEGPTRVLSGPPDLPPPEACVRAEPGTPVAPEIVGRFDMRLTPESTAFAIGMRMDTAEMKGWIRFADGREPDTHSLALFADAFPPPVANMLRAKWVPTIELTVHVRARPAPGWLRGAFQTRYLMNGYLEEDGELWDESDTLVAQSRQLARIFRADAPNPET
jgi:acyl-CoA thioesterase